MKTNYMQVIEQTDEQQTEMYLKLPKWEIILMLIEANKHLKNLSRVELPVILRDKLIDKRNKYKERYLRITKLEKKIALGGKIRGYAEAIQYANNLIDKPK